MFILLLIVLNIIYAPPVLGISIDAVTPSSGVKGDTIAVTGSGVTAGGTVNLYWDAVTAWDGEKGFLNSTEAKASGAFEVWFNVPEAVSGIHYIWLKDTDTGQTTSVTFLVINVSAPPPPPIANANGPYFGGAMDTIQFDSSGSWDPNGIIVKYEWDFGDKSEHSLDVNPTHVYPLKGNYTVTLWVTDDDYITVADVTWCDIAPRSPVADANGPYSGTEEVAISFRSAESYDIDGEIVEYRWNFGDGTGYFIEENPSHTYTSAGTFNVTLLVKDNDELTDTDTTMCTVELPPNTLPIANANGPYEVEVKKPITFSSAGSRDPDPKGEIVTYDWDFGDDSAHSSDENPSHTYEEPGTYNLKLTVTDDRGGVATDEAVCTVELPPNTLPIASANGPYSGTEEVAISFSSEESYDIDGEIVEYRWNFGDGTGYFMEENPSHTYEEPGTYTLKLTVTDDRGGVATDEAVCTVSKKPFPIFLIFGGLAVVGAAVAVFIMKRKPTEKPPKPVSIRVKADPMEAPADLRSTIAITVELLDEYGKPIPAAEDMEVTLSSSLGTITSPVSIPGGSVSGGAALRAGFEDGSFRVTAEAEGLKLGSVELTFTEVKRYCMHCGAKMSVKDSICSRCGKPPPSGALDVKVCKNCGEVIPTIAKFCNECGASQPEEGS